MKIKRFTIIITGYNRFSIVKGEHRNIGYNYQFEKTIDFKKYDNLPHQNHPQRTLRNKPRTSPKEQYGVKPFKTGSAKPFLRSHFPNQFDLFYQPTPV
ncbi:hypothetical protein [Mucilaginibacter oryzae]|uniref:hypothetical protein n=1 Tax=Mucilaginibacter oryzae TaxID=468058 RepID=UPI001475C4A6|nr:hypothetical protein [Mucilaginibacter oryzae]